MKRKGFTLIELLAVIVILAIIALIATPAVLNIIEDSRKASAEASARNIMNAAKTYYMSETMNGRTVGSIDLSTGTLKYDGDQASKGDITFTDGKPSGTMYIGGYCVTININGKVTSEKKAEDECEVEVSEPEATVKTYLDGEVVYFNPVNNAKCSETDAETNYDSYISLNNGLVGLTDGCMKWYAFLDSESSSTVNLLLDHNTIGFIEWSSNTQEDLKNGLQESSKNWNNVVKSTTRLISSIEVNKIAPLIPFTYEEYDANMNLVSKEISEWKVDDYSIWYYFHEGNQNEYIGEAGTNKYAWLFDNLDGCETYGCNRNDMNTWGYWTSSVGDQNYGWLVLSRGDFYRPVTAIDDLSGIRPVIEVDKEIFRNDDSSSNDDIGSCFAEGTLITLADGTQKPIENVTYEDELLVWDFYNGKYASSTPSLIEIGNNDEYSVLNLNFSDGTIVRIVDKHGFFSVEKNNYVFINEQNVKSYIGHEFIQTTNNYKYRYVKLVDYEVTVENIKYYTLLTDIHNNCIANNMFTLTPPPIGLDGWYDIFEITEEMKYDKENIQSEIDKYGLYEYADFEEYLTYEQFISFNGPYLKILVGRGIITYEQIIEAIDAFEYIILSK